VKIAIVGCGAMGSVYAGLFASAGHEVWAIDRWREHIEAIRNNGLRLEGKSGDRTVKVNATTDTRDAGTCDLVILATKAMHVAPAAESAKALLGKDTPVLSIQNGLGGPDTAAGILGRDRVLVGVVGVGLLVWSGMRAAARVKHELEAAADKVAADLAGAAPIPTGEANPVGGEANPVTPDLPAGASDPAAVPSVAAAPATYRRRANRS